MSSSLRVILFTLTFLVTMASAWTTTRIRPWNWTFPSGSAACTFSASATAACVATSPARLMTGGLYYPYMNFKIDNVRNGNPQMAAFQPGGFWYDNLVDNTIAWQFYFKNSASNAYLDFYLTDGADVNVLQRLFGFTFNIDALGGNLILVQTTSILNLQAGYTWRRDWHATVGFVATSTTLQDDTGGLYQSGTYNNTNSNSGGSLIVNQMLTGKIRISCPTAPAVTDDGVNFIPALSIISNMTATFTATNNVIRQYKRGRMTVLVTISADSVSGGYIFISQSGYVNYIKFKFSGLGFVSGTCSYVSPTSALCAFARDNRWVNRSFETVTAYVNETAVQNTMFAWNGLTADVAIGTFLVTYNPSKTRSMTLTPSATMTETISSTISQTASQSQSQTQSQSLSQSQTLSQSETQSQTQSQSQSQSLTQTQSQTASQTQSLSATISQTLSQTMSQSQSPSVSQTLSQTPSQSQSQTQSLTLSQTPSESASQSQSVSQTLTQTVSPSPSLSQTMSQTPSQSLSQSVSQTISPSQTGTHSQSISQSVSQSDTLSQAASQSESRPVTDSQTQTLSLLSTQSRTVPQTPSASSSQSQTPSTSSSQSASSSLSESSTGSYSPSVTSSQSLSESQSASPTTTESPSITNSVSPTLTLSLSLTLSPSSTVSESLTQSPTSSHSATDSFTVSLSGSTSSSISLTSTQSFTSTRTLTKTKSPSMTISKSGSPSTTTSLSLSSSQTVSCSKSGSRSATGSHSPSKSPSATLSSSSTESASSSDSPTRSTAVSVSRSPAVTQSTSVAASYSMSQPSTNSWSQASTVTESSAQTLTRSIVGSNSASAVMTPSQSPQGSHTSSASGSQSLAATQSVTVGNTDSKSTALTATPSSAMTPTQLNEVSESFEVTDTHTAALTDSNTMSQSTSHSHTSSASESQSRAATQSVTVGNTDSVSTALTATPSSAMTPTQLNEVSESFEVTATHTAALTDSNTVSQSTSHSQTATSSKVVSLSSTTDASGSPSTSVSNVLSDTMSAPFTTSPSLFHTTTISASNSFSQSHSDPSSSATKSFTTSPSASPSGSVSRSESPTVSPFNVPLTLNLTTFDSFETMFRAQGTFFHITISNLSAPFYKWRTLARPPMIDNRRFGDTNTTQVQSPIYSSSSLGSQFTSSCYVIDDYVTLECFVGQAGFSVGADVTIGISVNDSHIVSPYYWVGRRQEIPVGYLTITNDGSTNPLLLTVINMMSASLILVTLAIGGPWVEFQCLLLVLSSSCSPAFDRDVARYAMYFVAPFAELLGSGEWGIVGNIGIILAVSGIQYSIKYILYKYRKPHFKKIHQYRSHMLNAFPSSAFFSFGTLLYPGVCYWTFCLTFSSQKQSEVVDKGNVDVGLTGIAIVIGFVYMLGIPISLLLLRRKYLVKSHWLIWHRYVTLYWKPVDKPTIEFVSYEGRAAEIIAAPLNAEGATITGVADANKFSALENLDHNEFIGPIDTSSTPPPTQSMPMAGYGAGMDIDNGWYGKPQVGGIATLMGATKGPRVKRATWLLDDDEKHGPLSNGDALDDESEKDKSRSQVHSFNYSNGIMCPAAGPLDSYSNIHYAPAGAASIHLGKSTSLRHRRVLRDGSININERSIQRSFSDSHQEAPLSFSNAGNNKKRPSTIPTKMGGGGGGGTSRQIGREDSFADPTDLMRQQTMYEQSGNGVWSPIGRKRTGRSISKVESEMFPEYLPETGITGVGVEYDEDGNPIDMWSPTTKPSMAFDVNGTRKRRGLSMLGRSTRSETNRKVLSPGESMNIPAPGMQAVMQTKPGLLSGDLVYVPKKWDTCQESQVVDSAIARWMLPVGFYAPLCRNTFEQWNLVPDRSWFVVAPHIWIICVALTLGIQYGPASSTCWATFVVVASLYFIGAVVIIVLRPYRTRFTILLSVIVLLLCCIVCLLVLADTLFPHSARIAVLVLTFAALFIRSVHLLFIWIWESKEPKIEDAPIVEKLSKSIREFDT